MTINTTPLVFSTLKRKPLSLVFQVISEHGRLWDLGIGLHCCGAFTDMVFIIHQIHPPPDLNFIRFSDALASLALMVVWWATIRGPGGSRGYPDSSSLLSLQS